MDVELKKKIIKVIIGAVALILGACWWSSCQEEKEAEDRAKGFRKEVNSVITETRDVLNSSSESEQITK